MVVAKGWGYGGGGGREEGVCVLGVELLGVGSE